MAIAVLAAVGLLVVAIAVRPSTETPGVPLEPSPSPTAAATAASSPTAKPAAASGTITGALAYPSQFIPPLTVYAISVVDAGVFFSVETPYYPSGSTPAKPAYTIAGVAPGTYYVLGYRSDSAPNGDQPGVYSRYVLCGGTASCTDHSLVPVTVRAGETVTGIAVIDWYYPPEQRYPPRPRR